MNQITWWRSTTCLVAFSLAVAGCSSDQTTTLPPQGKSTADANTQPAESQAGVCSLFKTQEIKELLGAPVNEGLALGTPTECHWDGGDDSGSVFAQIRVTKDANGWINPKEAKGYEALSGLGKEAFVVPDENGWNARARTDTAVVSVNISGGKADRDRAVKLLRTLLERLK